MEKRFLLSAISLIVLFFSSACFAELTLLVDYIASVDAIMLGFVWKFVNIY